MSHLYDFAIIGGGPTGYTAAMYAGRLNLKTIIFTGAPGGLLVTIEKVENYPGFKSIGGYDLFQRIQEQAREYKVEERMSEVVEIGQVELGLKPLSGKFIIKTKTEEVRARTILFATGSRYRKLPLPEAAKFENKGIHYCALCDGFAYKGKVVAVVGGGDAAAKEALELVGQAKKVYLIVRGKQLKAEPINEKRIKEEPKIKIFWQSNIIKIVGNDKLESVEIDTSNKSAKSITLDGLFVAIGQVPLSVLAKKLGVKLNDQQQIIINRYAETNRPGVYAAGDVSDTRFKQLIIGCAEAVQAAHEAFYYITHNT